jgi:hypothetical protein
MFSPCEESYCIHEDAQEKEAQFGRLYMSAGSGPAGAALWRYDWRSGPPLNAGSRLLPTAYLPQDSNFFPWGDV